MLRITGMKTNLKDSVRRVRRHFSQSVEGALKHWGPKEWDYAAQFYHCESGREARERFMQWLKEGKRQLPLSLETDECDQFSYQEGCPGHPIN